VPLNAALVGGICTNDNNFSMQFCSLLHHYFSKVILVFGAKYHDTDAYQPRSRRLAHVHLIAWD
jgi:hypothetical protein